MDLRGLGPAAFVVCLTTKGSLSISLSTPEPLISKDAARGLLLRIVELLHQAMQ
jgi:hypothetical protein